MKESSLGQVKSIHIVWLWFVVQARKERQGARFNYGGRVGKEYCPIRLDYAEGGVGLFMFIDFFHDRERRVHGRAEAWWRRDSERTLQARREEGLILLWNQKAKIGRWRGVQVQERTYGQRRLLSKLSHINCLIKRKELDESNSNLPSCSNRKKFYIKEFRHNQYHVKLVRGESPRAYALNEQGAKNIAFFDFRFI